jgi:hypothetical protein
MNRQILIAELPQTAFQAGHFRMQTTPIEAVGEGQVLLRTRYLSLDAANRAWMQGTTYRAAVKAGDVMHGAALAEVLESRAAGFAVGDLVLAETGWQDYAVLPAKALTKLAREQPLTHLLSVYGIAGLTAYFGLVDIGQPKPGDTVVVSAAAGSVGLLAGQIARLKGARVVGIAGGAEKCARLTREFGFDAAIDYKAGSLGKALRATIASGIDLYFDNVGGPVFEACLFNMAQHGRIVCCGAVSQYDGAAPATGPRGVPGLIVTRRLRLEGFILYDHMDRAEVALAQLRQWVQRGELKVAEDVIEGLENAPAGLVGLLAGENFGKRMVRVAQEP